MSGRNWTRRSIEELVRAYMKKHGAGIQDLGYKFTGYLSDNRNVFPTSNGNYPYIRIAGDVIMNGISVNRNNRFNLVEGIRGFKSAYGNINEFGSNDFIPYFRALLANKPSEDYYGIYPFPFIMNGAPPTPSKYGPYSRKMDSYVYYPLSGTSYDSNATYLEGMPYLGGPTDDAVKKQFYYLIMRGYNGTDGNIIFADKTAVLKPFKTLNYSAYPNDVPNYDVVNISNGCPWIYLPGTTGYTSSGATLLPHSIVDEMSATTPFNNSSVFGILISDVAVDGVKTIEDYVNEWKECYGDTNTYTYKY